MSESELAVVSGEDELLQNMMLTFLIPVFFLAAFGIFAGIILNKWCTCLVQLISSYMYIYIYIYILYIVCVLPMDILSGVWKLGNTYYDLENGECKRDK